jgi:hypothetical protein
MKTLILFREGLSGHYLKALIDDTPDAVQFRVDPWYPGIYDNPKRPKYDKLETLASSECHCAHRKGIDVQKALSRYDLVLSILVNRKIYHGIYNNFYKKLLVEQLDLRTRFSRWHHEPCFWYDTAFYNLKEYYHLFRHDHIENTVNNIIDFDFILELDYIREIFQKYLNRDINDNTRRLVAGYRSQQLQYDLSGDERTMEDIVDSIPDDEFTMSPWFAAYCIFKYETNNQFAESQRLWSINEINGVIDKKTLLNIATKYNC